jgi:hypothetical protein
MTVESGLFIPTECAKYRRCSVRKLDRERADGTGCPYVRIDGRIFYRRTDVDDFIAANVRGGGGSGAERLPHRGIFTKTTTRSKVSS